MHFCPNSTVAPPTNKSSCNGIAGGALDSVATCEKHHAAVEPVLARRFGLAHRCFDRPPTPPPQIYTPSSGSLLPRPGPRILLDLGAVFSKVSFLMLCALLLLLCRLCFRHVYINTSSSCLCTHRGARTHDHKVKSLALCRLS